MTYIFDFDGTIALAKFTDENGSILNCQNTPENISFRNCTQNIYDKNPGIKIIIENIKNLLEKGEKIVVLSKASDSLEYEYKKKWLSEKIAPVGLLDNNFSLICTGTTQAKLGIIRFLSIKDKILYIDDNLESLIEIEEFVKKNHNVFGFVDLKHISTYLNEIL